MGAKLNNLIILFYSILLLSIIKLSGGARLPPIGAPGAKGGWVYSGRRAKAPPPNLLKIFFLNLNLEKKFSTFRQIECYYAPHLTIFFKFYRPLRPSLMNNIFGPSAAFL